MYIDNSRVHIRSVCRFANFHRCDRFAETEAKGMPNGKFRAPTMTMSVSQITAI